MSIARPLRTALVAAVAWGAIAGCSDGGTVDEAATTTTRPEPTLDPTTTAPPTDEEAILAAVDGFIESTFTINDPPDPDHPDLARYRTGQVREAAVEGTRERQSRGQAFRLPPNSIYEHRPTIVNVEPTRAVVQNCVVDDGQLVDIASGTVLDGTIVSKLFVTTLDLVEDVWKVAGNSVVEEWPGVSGCASE
jgi:hypothetical protein